jgi:predicted kinase
MVIVVSGPPCVGKTAVAEPLAREFGFPLFSVDLLQQVLARPELMVSPGQLSRVGATAIELQSALLERQLALGVGAILEHTVDRGLRERWKAIAGHFDAPYFGIECVCSDRALHRQRFDARPEFRIGEWLLTWEFIERTLNTYAPDEEAAIVLDSTNPLEQNVATTFAALRALRPSTPCDPHAAG